MYEPDSSFSHSACQIVPEKEVECLKITRSRLVDVCHSHNDKDIKDINRTTSLFPMEPHRTNGGMVSGHLQTYTNLEVQQYTPLRHNDLIKNVAIQEKSRETASSFFPQQEATIAAAKTFLKTMARENDVEENGRGGPINTVESLNPTIMYLIMPSYAEPYKQEIKHIIQQEKKKLCNNKTFKNVFKNVDFSLAFANSKNIKQIGVRTKL